MSSPAAVSSFAASAVLSTPDQSSLLQSSLALLSSSVKIFEQKVQRLHTTFGAGANDARAQAAELEATRTALEDQLIRARQIYSAEPAHAEVLELEERLADIRRMLTATNNWLGHFSSAIKTISDRIEWVQRIQKEAATTSIVEVAMCFLDALDLMLSLRLVESQPALTQGMREWAGQADPVLTALVESLTPQQLGDRGSALVSAAISPGALALVPGIIRKTGCACAATYSGSSDPQLTQLLSTDFRHPIELNAWLGLIRFGLDPTIGVAGQPNSSGLDLMRKFVAQQPWPADAAPPAIPVSDSPLPNFIPTYASVVILADEKAEQKRREALLFQFMHAFHLFWRDHSRTVRGMLLEAAPDALIPDLANLCADYLDLERV